MCEIPANVILADEFLKIFDGYSIGSNDLTQLTLGLDRDSGTVAHLFDENNAAVRRMIASAIRFGAGSKKAYRNLRAGAVGFSRICRVARNPGHRLDLTESRYGH